MTLSDAAKIVINTSELQTSLRELLIDPDTYQKMSSSCLKIFETNKGALDFAINEIREFI